MISASVRFTASLSKISNLRDVLFNILGRTQAMPECISCRLYKDEANPNSWLLLEEWRSEEGLKRHIKSEAYRAVLEAMELSSETPEVQFTTGSKTEGFELIENIRSGR